MTTFAVDAVEEARTPLDTVPLGTLVGKTHWMAPGADTPVVDPQGIHPLLAAVHQAFAEHRPLVLSPDVVWLTLAQGVAQHIRLNAERLRERLVRHEGRRNLKVQVGAVPRTDEDFLAILEDFRGQLREAMGPGLPRLMSCDFSTSTDIERMAGDVVLMDAMSPYFDFTLAIRCGIPRVTLLGTPEDWRAIRRRIDVIAELDLAWWTSSLIPIADELVRASEGQPDRQLWTELYKPAAAYGWDRMAGWVMRLFPYIGQSGSFDQRNPLLAQSHAEFLKSRDAALDDFDVPGVALHWVPAGLSCVPLRVQDEPMTWRETWSLEAGVLAVTVAADGALMPRAGVMVRSGGASVDLLIERLVAEHSVVRATQPSTYRGLAELNALYDHLASATLFPGTRPWRVRPTAEHVEVHIPLEGDDFTPVRCVADLPDGTVLALRSCSGRRPSCFVRLRADALKPMVLAPGVTAAETVMLDCETLRTPLRSRQRATDIPVVGTSLTALLLQALDQGGATELPASGSLADQLEAWENPGARRRPSSP